MMPSGQKAHSSPLALLTFCLALLAVALAGVALLMIHDHLVQTEGPPEAVRPKSARREAAKPPAPEWSWDSSISRVENYVEQAYDRLTGGGEKAAEAADEHLKSADGEIAGWREKAEPRFRELVEKISRQAGEVRKALVEKSEQAAEKLAQLRESLQGLREKVGKKSSEE